ncbi:sugar nucleotide-binding protein [Vibrio ulleungensis]|uniref:dTDP-4-dehydrorhamnose reductase n=1 Tax=Vibrio ulleungensis TaxID=2807619 RepID=A0ABS2HIJ3_9VIBR|nr:sugar nucleotide-binding protein [Vibrio ulleungensis]MBM7037335.1 sugar nucleotide-binding protein [Vibrio ulleungensis]
MKKLLMTGMSGTLAPIVVKYFAEQQWQVVEWDHHTIDPQDAQKSQAFVDTLNIDAICHLAMGSPNWAGFLAQTAKSRDIPFVFTSTVMVFNSNRNGPYSIFDERSSRDDYGQYKMSCEDEIWAANPEAMIARIGWQIGSPTQGGNNMLEILNKQADETGKVQASTLWYPATSLMTDTAKALFQLIETPQQGLHHFDSNFDNKWSFFDLVNALNEHYQLGWTIEATQDYSHDQRLAPLHFNVPSLDTHFTRST